MTFNATIINTTKIDSLNIEATVKAPSVAATNFIKTADNVTINSRLGAFFD